MAVYAGTSLRQVLPDLDVRAGMRAALRRGHDQYHRLVMREATGDLPAGDAGLLAAWRRERAGLRGALERRDP